MSSSETSDNSKALSGTPNKAPRGTVTFLFTDIEGSTELLKYLGAQYIQLLVDQRQILREIAARWDGHEVDTQGDAFFFSFARATQAVEASVDIQRTLDSHPWPEEVSLKLRMGLHTGEPWDTEEGYIGMDVHRAARIAHAGYGGQVLLSDTTASLVLDDLPSGVGMLDLGYHELKGLRRPEHIHQLVIEGLTSEFPPLKSMGIYPSEGIKAPRYGQLPDFLQTKEIAEEIRPVCVSREVELEKLECMLQKALSGHGGVVFITGEAGQGKTALMNEFSWRSTERYPELLVLRGNCNAYAGIGDPYLPFRDILAMLCGELETRLTAGLINREQAGRLWDVLPRAMRAVVDFAPDLINRLIPGRSLIIHAQEHGGVQPELLGRLQILAGQSPQQSSARGLDQVAIFEQFTRMLSELAKHDPLLLFADDLQWVDTGSANLFFHLGRRLAGKPVLMVGSYRPEEIELGREGGRHPLVDLLAEYKRQFGDIWIDLDMLDSERERQFVEELLKAEPNIFSKSFRDALYEHTEGHPLFTIELLKHLQEQGVLVQDENGRWVELSVIDWERIPSRIEGVIEERIGRVEPEQREILAIASVEGERFTAQIIARILNLNERELLRTLGQSLDRKYSLISDGGVERLGQQILFRFSFRHNLFQKYLYDRLSEPERLFLHKAVAEQMEELFTDHLESVLPQLARHFALAGLAEKAIHYYTLAGKSAIRVSANHEAISHFRHALGLLATLPPSLSRDQKELDLQLSLGPPLTAIKGWAAPELGMVYDRAQELCTEKMDDARLVRGLWLLATYRLGRSEHEQVEMLVHRLSSLAKRTQDPELLCLAGLSVHPLYQGKLVQARNILEEVSRLYDPEQQLQLAHRYGMAPSIVGQSYLSNCLWMLGYPEMAQRSIRQALEWAEEINVPFTTCYVLGRACWQYAQLNDFETTRKQAEKLAVITKEYKFKNFELSAVFYLNWANLKADRLAGGELDRMFSALEEYRAMGTLLNRTTFLVLYADACAVFAETGRGLAALAEAIELGENTGEQWLQAEAYRLKGELLAQAAEKTASPGTRWDESAQCLKQAYEIARKQQAKSLELRADISLYKWSKQLRGMDDAFPKLKSCYQSFSEGFETADLLSAQALLGFK